MSNLKVKIIDEVDKAVWNRFVETSKWGDILNLWEWGEYKKEDGWRPLRVGVIEDNQLIMIAQILLRKVFLLGNYAYLPHGPVFHNPKKLDPALKAFNKFILNFSKVYNLICLEVEPKVGKLVDFKKKPVVSRPTSYSFEERLEKIRKNKMAESLLAKQEDFASISEEENHLSLNTKHERGGFSLNLKNLDEEPATDFSFNLQKTTGTIAEKQLIKFDKNQLNFNLKLPTKDPFQNLEEKIKKLQTEDLALKPAKTNSLILRPIFKIVFSKLEKRSQESIDGKTGKDSKKTKNQNIKTSVRVSQNQDKTKTTSDVKNIPQVTAADIKADFKEQAKVRTEAQTGSADFLNFYAQKEVLQTFINNGYLVTGRFNQPKYKVFYNLNLSEDELLQKCKKETRYNIHKAKKNGVEFKEYDFTNPLISTKLVQFHNLLKSLEKRTGNSVINLKHLKSLVKKFRKTNYLKLHEVSYKGEVLAMNISQQTKFWASSFYSASSQKHSNLKADYLLRFSTIMQAKAKNIKLYDFWEILPEQNWDEGYVKKKLSFGGERLDQYGLLVFPVSPIKFAVWDVVTWLKRKLKKKFTQKK